VKKTNKRKKAYKLIDRVFRSEKRIRQAVDEARHSTIGSRKGEGGSGHPSGISDPTANTAIHAISEIKSVIVDDLVVHRPEKWLKVIGLTYGNSGEAEQKLMRQYYNGWPVTEIAAKNGNGYSEQTLFYILSSFRQLAAEIACQYGLIHVVE
jgi:hypothetical protein